jgi:hypothetical protein
LAFSLIFNALDSALLTILYSVYKRPCALTQSPISFISLVQSGKLTLQPNSIARSTSLLPDRDSAGSKLVERAIELGWSVSLPDWTSDINDIGDCVNAHGRLYTLYSIVSSAESSALKIRLKAKKWFT